MINLQSRSIELMSNAQEGKEVVHHRSKATFSSLRRRGCITSPGETAALMGVFMLTKMATRQLGYWMTLVIVIVIH